MQHVSYPVLPSARGYRFLCKGKEGKTYNANGESDTLVTRTLEERCGRPACESRGGISSCLPLCKPHKLARSLLISNRGGRGGHTCW